VWDAAAAPGSDLACWALDRTWCSLCLSFFLLIKVALSKTLPVTCSWAGTGNSSLSSSWREGKSQKPETNVSWVGGKAARDSSLLITASRAWCSSGVSAGRGLRWRVQPSAHGSAALSASPAPESDSWLACVSPLGTGVSQSGGFKIANL